MTTLSAIWYHCCVLLSITVFHYLLSLLLLVTDVMHCCPLEGFCDELSLQSKSEHWHCLLYHKHGLIWIYTVKSNSFGLSLNLLQRKKSLRTF